MFAYELSKTGTKIIHKVYTELSKGSIGEGIKRMASITAPLHDAGVVTHSTFEKVRKMEEIFTKYLRTGNWYDELCCICANGEDPDDKLSHALGKWYIRKLLNDKNIVEKIGKCEFEQLKELLDDECLVDDDIRLYRRMKKFNRCVAVAGRMYYLLKEADDTYAFGETAVRKQDFLLDEENEEKLIEVCLTDFLYYDRENNIIYGKISEDTYFKYILKTKEVVKEKKKNLIKVEENGDVIYATESGKCYNGDKPYYELNAKDEWTMRNDEEIVVWYQADQLSYPHIRYKTGEKRELPWEAMKEYLRDMILGFVMEEARFDEFRYLIRELNIWQFELEDIDVTRRNLNVLQGIEGINTEHLKQLYRLLDSSEEQNWNTEELAKRLYMYLAYEKVRNV